jgi:uptake hydrogenase large subunit
MPSVCADGGNDSGGGACPMHDQVDPVSSLDGASGEVELRLRLHAAGGRIVALEIDNRRPTGLLSALAGCDADRAPALLRRLFPLCGDAHAIACTRAISAARAAPEDDDSACTAMLAAEQAVAHGWRSLFDWPALLDRPAEPGRLQPLVAAAARLRAAAVAGTERSARPTEVVDCAGSLAEALMQAVFGPSRPADGSPQALIDWAGSCRDSSSVAELLATVAASPLAAVERPAVRRLSVAADGGIDGDVSTAMPAADWFGARLAGDPAFGRQPSLDGLPAEVGAYAACSSAERTCFDRSGPLAARLLAMLGSAAALAAALRRVGAGSAADAHGDPGGRLEPGSGCGLAATARGPLAYWVRLDGARIAALRSVAPTEWALHPQGPLSTLLRGLPVADGVLCARLAAAAFDPCAVLGVELVERDEWEARADA